MRARLSPACPAVHLTVRVDESRHGALGTRCRLSIPA